jgi:hypothetical protein
MSTNVELIIYLEPNPEFKHTVENFLKESAERFGPTTANKYDCHITMTGFFTVKDSNEQSGIKHMLNDILTTNFRIPQINLKSLLVQNDKTHLPIHLLLPVTAPKEYHTAMSNLAEKCKNIVSLRLKKINHVSLAYWDEPEATPTQKTQWEELVSNGIFDKIQQAADLYFQDIMSPHQWDIVLYQRVLKGALVDQHHVFKELGRWRCN